MISSLACFCFDAAAADKLQLRVDDQHVSISAQDVPVESIIHRLAQATGLRLVQHVPLDRTVSISIDQPTLPAALDELLDGESYQLYQGVTDEIPGTLWIFADGADAAPHATLFFEAVILYGSYAEKKEAIRELRRLGTPEAVQTLSLALGDEDERVPGVALEALEHIGGDEALAAIASATAAADPWIRGQAIEALASGDSKSARQYLQMVSDDSDPNVRLAVVEALSENPDGQSIAVLSDALNDPDVNIRMYAVDALEAVGGELAFQALMQARADRDAEVRESVEESLSLLMQQP